MRERGLPASGQNRTAFYAVENCIWVPSVNASSGGFQRDMPMETEWLAMKRRGRQRAVFSQIGEAINRTELMLPD